MPRRRCPTTANIVFHVLNRGVRRLRLFDDASDYLAFCRLLRESWERTPIRILAFCVMPNHFHLVLWPRTDAELREFVGWLTLTHSKRWHAFRGTTGTGHVYQDRYKAIPVQADRHLLRVCRYVERNAVTAGLVTRAEDWRWCSLYQRCRNCSDVPLEQWPVLQPADWLTLVNSVDDAGEVARLRDAVRRDQPYGTEGWTLETAKRLGLSLPRSRPGRPPGK